MQKRKGISLIVLVITIIVMTILAGAIILTLNNSGIINKATDAVEQTNLDTVKEVAQMAWAEAYAGGTRTQQELESAVTKALITNNITEDKYSGYVMMVTTAGVNFLSKNELSTETKHKGIIPTGGIYYTGVKSTQIGIYTGATNVYKEGERFPTKVTTGDVYVYGDYEYRYNQWWNEPWNIDDTQNGWGVRVINDEKTTYGIVLEEINNAPLVLMKNTFALCHSLTNLSEGFTIPNGVTNVEMMFIDCSELETVPEGFMVPGSVISAANMFDCCMSLTKLPESFKLQEGITNVYRMFSDCAALTSVPEDFTLPNSVTNASCLFEVCYSLASLPEGFTIPKGVTDTSYMFQCCSFTTLPEGLTIPNGVTNTSYMFEGCAKLTSLPEGLTIPNGVTNASYMFGFCENLTSLPQSFTIPASVTNIVEIFGECKSLKGNITINANPTNYSCCFANCDMTKITLTGSSSMLDVLANETEY